MSVRIQLLIAGFNRSLSRTLPSIEKNVIRPLAWLANDLRVSFVLSRSWERVFNSRSGEDSFAEYELPERLKNFSTVVIEQSELDSRQQLLRDELFEEATPPTREDYLIVENIIRFLGVLRLAHQSVWTRADYVFFARPDLLWHQRLRLPGLTDWQSGLPSGFDGLMSANWGGGEAPNDRFGLVSQNAVEDYFLRIRRFKEFLQRDLPFSAENFLDFSMTQHAISPSIPTRASRVRVGGVVKPERFRPSKIKAR